MRPQRNPHIMRRFGPTPRVAKNGCVSSPPKAHCYLQTNETFPPSPYLSEESRSQICVCLVTPMFTIPASQSPPPFYTTLSSIPNSLQSTPAALLNTTLGHPCWTLPGNPPNTNLYHPYRREEPVRRNLNYRAREPNIMSEHNAHNQYHLLDGAAAPEFAPLTSEALKTRVPTPGHVGPAENAVAKGRSLKMSVPTPKDVSENEHADAGARSPKMSAPTLKDGRRK